jgi:Reverse transcriptase (RNA-dependent DNA polymerase)
LACSQAPVECNLYIEVPRGHLLYNEHRKFAFKLKQNLYGQKQPGRVWYKYLTTTLLKKVSSFYFNNCIILVYVDDTIIAGPPASNVNEVIKTLSTLFKIKDQGKNQ